MARHVFLTGEKGAGKSTVLKKVLLMYKGKAGDFFYGTYKCLFRRQILRTYIPRRRKSGADGG